MRRRLVLAVLLVCALALVALADDAADPSIPLNERLRFIVRPTLLGLVPPNDPQGYGEALVRVREVGEDAVVVHYEIKEEVAEADEDGGDSGEKRTRIRRGDVRATGLDGARRFIAPLFWGDGDWETESSLMWLSTAAFAELKRTGRATLTVDLGGHLPPEEAAGLADPLAAHLGDGLDGGAAAATLEIEREAARYPCVFNGEMLTLPAIEATDSLGLARYWILDDAANPLVLKLSFIAWEREADDDAAPVDLAGPAGFIVGGGGYAVTEINN